VKLRARLGLTLLALVVPFSVGLSFLQLNMQRSAFEEGAADAILERMQGGARLQCEIAPESWPWGGGRGPRGPGPRLVRRAFAYDASFRSLNPEAPPFDPSLRAELESSDPVAAKWSLFGGSGLVAVRMPWDDGPCAIVVVEGAGGPGGRALRRSLWPALLISAAAVLMAVLVAGPPVRGIRGLIGALRRPNTEEPMPGQDRRDEIGELARAFEESRTRIRAQIAQLEARDSALRSYIADTTHDVMTPVTVIQGHLASLERDMPAGRETERARVTAALEECHHLASIVHNLNAAAKLEAGEPHTTVHPLDLAALVERAVERHRPFARQRSVALDFAVPEGTTEALADVTLVEQAVGNLVHNAVRYNGPGGHVAVVLERVADGFELRVVDDGPGLSDEELARATERGFRGEDARKRHPHGMGLGLAIVRDVAERHGWTFELIRAPEGGLAAVLRGHASNVA